MDALNPPPIGLLQLSARRTIAELARRLSVWRGEVRHRLSQPENSQVILGDTARLRPLVRAPTHPRLDGGAGGG